MTVVQGSGIRDQGSVGGRKHPPGPWCPVSGHRSLRVAVKGLVQGVGFRPFVYRLATGLGLHGWVNNSPQGVRIEVEGPQDLLDEFILRLTSENPPHSSIQSIEVSAVEPVGYVAFEIRPSAAGGAKSALILPDLATCLDCLRDVFEPSNRRYLYPFTNCTNCGPRFTIIESLPYDRPNTTMKGFPMCPECLAEYEDPLDRRFHAQPNACPVCGPHLELWAPAGDKLSTRHSAMLATAAAIRDGAIVAVKGLGGFLLMADARRDDVVALLRERKHRQEKPFALMYPSLAWVEEHCEVSEAEARLLRSSESPIVLLRRRWGSREIAPQVAPNSPTLGAVLPYTPLHHLLMAELGFPVVATSGNLSDEPICTDEHEALERLAGIADFFLAHNRPIARHMDDSVARVLVDREMVLRRARGYAPLPVRLAQPVEPMLAVGAHLKNSVALAIGQDVFISQHTGDLESTQASEAFRRSVADLQRLYDATPTAIACDMHPDYLSTKHAEASGLPVRKVQHHAAHVYSCIAENGIAPGSRSCPVLGVSWDGTGYGEDGTVWGGEFFLIGGQGRKAEGSRRWTMDDGRYAVSSMLHAVNPDHRSLRRVAHLRTFRLIGGEQAVKEPRRSAVAVLYEMLGEGVASGDMLPMLPTCSGEAVATWVAMLKRGINVPLTSSAGRLFDAVASMVGIRHIASFEGQAAMELEYAIAGVETDECYGFNVGRGSNDQETPMPIDWASMIREILRDLSVETSAATIAARFHNTLVEMIVEVARLVDVERVALTGGCFQNAYLLERSVRRLRSEGFRPYWHRLVPPNDGGIALGQIMAASLAVEAAPQGPLEG